MKNRQEQRKVVVVLVVVVVVLCYLTVTEKMCYTLERKNIHDTYIKCIKKLGEIWMHVPCIYVRLIWLYDWSRDSWMWGMTL